MTCVSVNLKRLARALAVILTFASFASFASCAEETVGSAETTAPEVTATAEETEVGDDLPALDFDGYAFRIVTREVGHIDYKMNVDDINGEPINDAIYNRNRIIEQRFDTVITETYSDQADFARKSVLAGEDAYDLIKTRGPMAMTYWQEDLIYTVDKLPYINLDKPYWDASLNKSLTIGNIQYIITGALSTTEYQYTSVLLFNKGMIEEYTLDNPYTLVDGGAWTFDKMAEMMAVVTNDLNGDSVMDGEDIYGFLSTYKQVLPSFIVAAGLMTISKDSDDMPYLSMDSDRFVSVFNKIFEITRDNNAWYVDKSSENVTPDAIRMFSGDRGLFIEIYLFYINQFRDMDTNFGIIPYPMYDESQERYYAKCGWVEPFVVPITSTDLERTSAVIEALCCESAKLVIPAYYDIALKTKISRDDESEAMLDLVFSNRVLDYGDTVWNDIVRDGTLSAMFLNDNRNIASKIPNMQKKLDAQLKKLDGKLGE